MSKLNEDEEESISTGGTPTVTPENGIKSAEKPAPVPEERELTLRSALQVVGGFMLLFNSWGYLNSFGVFQDYYGTVLIPSSSDSQISWIGSMQAFLLLLGSAVVGRLFDAGYLRSSLRIGSVLLVFTTCMTSLASEWYQLFLYYLIRYPVLIFRAQGIGAGIAVGILFIPAVACVSTWFKRRRALALGIVASGSSVGAVIYPIALEKLIPQIGFPWAVRVIALLQLCTLAIPNLFMKSRLPPRGAGPLIELRAFLQPSYSIFTIALYLAFWGLYTPFFYATSYATSVGAPPSLIPYVLSLMNAASIFGRILPNFVADGLGPINVLIPTIVAAGALLFGWFGTSTWRGFLVFAMLYGFFSGTLVSLPPACVVSLTEPSEMSKIGVRMGMVFSVIGFATLTGTPIAGALISRDNGGYTYAIIFSGIAMFLGSALLILARIVRVGPKLKVKA